MKKKKQKLSYVLGLLALLSFLLFFFQTFIWGYLYKQRSPQEHLEWASFLGLFGSFIFTSFYIATHRAGAFYPKWKTTFDTIRQQGLLPIVFSVCMAFFMSIFIYTITPVVYLLNGMTEPEEIGDSALKFGTLGFMSSSTSAVLAGIFPRVETYKSYAKKISLILAILAATALLALLLMWSSGKYDAFFGALW